jgi:DNA invertase Pin-like site-specific DNA recombinase
VGKANTARRNRSLDEVIALGYVRVSTVEQGDSGLGLDAQRAAIEAECQRRGWTLQKLAQDVASAKTTNRRPALAEALDALDRGHADALIVAKVDRLARSLIDLAGILDRSRRHGWKLVVLDLGLDPSTATGELTAHILGAVAQHERRLISDRTSAALRAKRAQGYRLGRPVLLPDMVRRRIVAERTSGATLTAIADCLTAEGVPTAQGGTRWYPSSVKAVLQSVELDAATA